MIDINTDYNCASASPIDYTFFPSITARKKFDFQAFTAQLTALDEFVTEEPLVIYEEPIPSPESVLAAEKEVFKSFGDARFNGESAFTFLHTRYKAIGIEDSMSYPDSNILVASACDVEGFPYTYHIPNSATYYDSEQKEITLPVFDKYGVLVVFPLTDNSGKFVLNEPLTALDSVGSLIRFPLKDINNKYVAFPFKSATGEIIVVPPRNQEQLLNVPQAYKDLDQAYENAKTANAYEFAQYIISLETSNRVGFFYSTVTVPTQNNTIPYFGAGVYNLTAADIDLSDIVSQDLEYFIRYYPDKAQDMYKFYIELGGTGPYTEISSEPATNLQEAVSNENIKNASYSILSAPFWTEDTPVSDYQQATVGPAAVHTSILELYTKAVTAEQAIITLNNTIQDLTNKVSTLSASLNSLNSAYTATSALVEYNSKIIDIIVTPSNWQNIWASPLAVGYIPPATPSAR